MFNSQLDTLVNSLPGPAHARTTDTSRYLTANQYHATNHGFSSIDAAIGITPQDIYHHRSRQLEILEGSLFLEAQHKLVVEALNYQADQSTQPVCSKICTLFPTGFILEGILHKMPILGFARPVVAVLSFFEDRTHKLNLFELYYLYKKHYSMRRAINQFLKYLNIKKHFNRLPTNQELIVLLILRENPISKYAAKILGISSRTVEEYKARLRNKLDSISLENVLILLRTYSNKFFLNDSE